MEHVRVTEGLVTVERTLRIIEFLAEADSGLSLSELARRLNVNKSIALRILGTLELLSYVHRHPDTQHYLLTYKLSNLGLRQLTVTRLLDQCQPVLRNLADATGELVRLAVIENEHPLWIHAVMTGRQRVQIDPRYGLDVSLHSHATGKAWLSTLNNDDLDRVLGKEDLSAITPHTITSKDKLKRQLNKIRVARYAKSFEEHELGLAAIASPILVREGEPDERCVGVVSIVAPVFRWTPDVLAVHSTQLVRSTAKLGQIWPLTDPLTVGAVFEKWGG